MGWPSRHLTVEIIPQGHMDTDQCDLGSSSAETFPSQDSRLCHVDIANQDEWLSILANSTPQALRGISQSLLLLHPTGQRPRQKPNS